MAWNGQFAAQQQQQQMTTMPAGYEHLTPEQQQLMVQQNWQQWQSYYQQYAQWQAQYGQQYQQELTKLQPPLPEQQPPPPPPPSSGEGKPPPPPMPEEIPNSSVAGGVPSQPPRRNQNQPYNQQQQNQRPNQQQQQSFNYDGPDQYQQGTGGGGGGVVPFDNTPHPNDRRRNQNQQRNNNMQQQGDTNRFNNNNTHNNRQFNGPQQAPGRGRGGGQGGRRGGRGNRFNNNYNNQQNWHENQWNDGGGGGGGGGQHNQQYPQRFHNNNNQQQHHDRGGPSDYNQEDDHHQNSNYYGGPNQMNNQDQGDQEWYDHNDQQQGYRDQPQHQSQQHQHSQQQQHQNNNNVPGGSRDEPPQGPTRAQQQQWDKEDDEDERVFDEQFRKWEDQFNNWKMQNQDHPDRSSYVRYEREFEDVRIRLMERRDQMRQRRLSARQEILKTQAPEPQSRQQQNIPNDQHQQHKQQQQQNTDNQPHHQIQPQGFQKNQFSTPAPPPPPPPEETQPEETRQSTDEDGEGAEWNDHWEDKEEQPQEEEKEVSGTSENVDSLFSRSAGGGGIPGLDLVEPAKEKELVDGEVVINLEEEEAAAAKSKAAEGGGSSGDTDDRQGRDVDERSGRNEPGYELDPVNINNILQNRDIMNLLNRVNRPEEVQPKPATPVVPNVIELLQDPNIQGVLNKLQQPPAPLQQPQGPNINELLQNPNISNLLDQVMGGGGQRAPPPMQSHANFSVWNNAPGNFQNIDPFGNRGGFESDLPPAFRGNPNALGPQFLNGPPGNFDDRGMNQRSQFGNPSYGQGNQHFGGPMPQQNFQHEQYNMLPPAIIHGGRNPEADMDFRRRPKRPPSDILVPTQVVDYQHRSVAGEKKPLTDYFHRKDQVASGPSRRVDTPSGRSVFATQPRWAAGAKRRSRFSDSMEIKKPRPEDERRPNRAQQWKEKKEDFRALGRGKDVKEVSASKEATKDKEKKPAPSAKAEDYLEGISDEEIEAMDNDEPVDMEEDNFSLSSVEDLPEVDEVAPVQGDPNLISIEKLLLNPDRKRRPRKILILIRGLPGSGKTHIARLIKDKEVEMGGSPPRILSIDDYFTTETDEVSTCPKTGKDINVKSMVYEYEEEMEEQYLQYLMKAYKKTVSDGYFDFIVVDAVYQKMAPVLEIAAHARTSGFVSYICSLEVDVATCLEQNTHGRTEAQLEALSAAWEVCPKEQLRLDIKPLIEWSRITELPVEDISNDELDLEEESDDDIPLEERKMSEPKKLATEDIPLSERVKNWIKMKAPEVVMEATEQVEEAGDTVEKLGDTVDDEGGTVEEVKDVDAKEGIVQSSKEVESVTGSEVIEENKDPENETSRDKLEKVDVMQVNEEIGVNVDEGTSVDVSNEEVPELDGEQDWKKEKTSVPLADDEEGENEEDRVELEAQLQEELDTNFEDLEGDAPVDDEDAEDEEVEANPEPIDESLFKSKWDSDPKEDRLAKMDGISKPLRPPTIEEYLQQDDYLQTFEAVEPGKKRVRWADIEEKKAQDKMRAIGFVVGQTDWNRMMDPTEGQGALTKTKFIERVRKDDPS